MAKTLLELAFSELGIKEVKGSKHNHEIVNYAIKTGNNWVDNDEVPWCGFFIGSLLVDLDIELPKYCGRAKSYLNIGTEININEAKPNDLVIFTRNGGGHVAIVLGYTSDGKYIHVIGGNQGDAVSITKFPMSMVVGVRRLSKMSSVLEAPKIDLVRGQQNQNVKTLQRILNKLGYNCGRADGIFGGKTANALLSLQKEHSYSLTGNYGKHEYYLISTLLNNKNMR